MVRYSNEDLFMFKDYWVSVLHKRLVKETVLNITNLNEGNSPTLRAYAHCSSSNSVVVFGVNIANISQGFLLPMNTTGQLYCIHSSDLLSRLVLIVSLECFSI